MKKIFNWIKHNKVECFIFVLIILLATFLRLYKISGYMNFLGDEGRDALVVRDLLVNHHFPFIGPPTSIGNIYLGPLYYYMMAIPMAISWLNPVAAAIMVAILGIISVFLIYYLAREFFGKIPAIVSSLLFTISPVLITYSRSSWNPNPAPFFSLLTLLFLYLTVKYRNFLYFLGIGFGVAALWQMHGLALIFAPAYFTIWLYELYLQHKKNINFKHFKTGTIGAVVIFFVMMLPLMLFDFKHNFMNLKAYEAFFLNRQTTVNINPFNTLERVFPVFNYDLVGRYFSVYGNIIVNIILDILIILPIIFGIYLLIVKKNFDWKLFSLAVLLLFGIGGLSLYKQSIFDHYVLFVSPIAFLLLGGFVNLFKGNLKLIIGTIIIGVVGYFCLQNNPLLFPPNNELERTQQIAKFIINLSNNKPFNFALLSDHNYDSAYQFYLTVYNHPPQKLPFAVTDQLFVVCENPVCKPINNPKYEIAAYGWSKIVAENNFNGIKVYKLIHNR